MGQRRNLGIPNLSQTHVLPLNPIDLDLRGWNFNHSFFDKYLPRHSANIVEIGVWKGASTIAMASILKSRATDGVIFAVDTFLGSHEHHANPVFLNQIGLNNGRLTMLDTFISNIRQLSLDDLIYTVSLDSVSASKVFFESGTKVDFLHLDGGHSYLNVIVDLISWWQNFSTNAILIADDYTDDWPEVKNAIDAFIEISGSSVLEIFQGKIAIRVSGLSKEMIDKDNLRAENLVIPLAKIVNLF